MAASSDPMPKTTDFPGDFPGATAGGSSSRGRAASSTLRSRGLRGKVRGALLLLLLALFGVPGAPAAQPLAETDDLPTLILDLREGTPGELRRVSEQVRAFDRERLRVAMDLAGLSEPGDPILLLLVAENTAVARQTPPWISGYARGYRSLAVVFPGRVPSYPDRSLEAVIQHEVAHVLVHRAAGGQGVPRWFNEGVAMTAGRAWTLEDRGRLTWGVLTGGPRGFRDVERAFGQGPGAAAMAYALSHALVRELRRDAGPEVTGEILRRMRSGERFAEAFAGAAGRSLEEFERSFFRDQTFWNRWVPFLTSSAVLWIAITFLFLVAYRRRRARDAELAASWEAEERALAEVRLRVIRGEQLDEESPIHSPGNGRSSGGDWIH